MMRAERFDSPSQAESELAQDLVRLSVPDIFPHFSTSNGSVELDVPADLDIDTAARQWESSGGQVRTFNYGSNAEMRLKTYSLPDWLVRTQGAQYHGRVAEQ